MRRAARVIATIGILATLSTIAGCAPMPNCSRGIRLGHPTMTAGNLTFGNEARVRGTTEGATGGVK